MITNSFHEAFPILSYRARRYYTCVERTRLSAIRGNVRRKIQRGYTCRRRRRKRRPRWKKQETSGAESHRTRRHFRHGLSVNLTLFVDRHNLRSGRTIDPIISRPIDIIAKFKYISLFIVNASSMDH